MHRIKPEQKAFATSLRNGATDAERALWKSLRGDALNGLRFRRQFPIGIYIVDFVCFEVRLIVEVDGGQHAESQHDESRDGWLKSEGFDVLRFWNNEVLQNMEGVMQVIAEAINTREQILPPPQRVTREPFQVSGEGWGEVKTKQSAHPHSALTPLWPSSSHGEGA
jgi:very-short-patch-repair endonuclease